MRAFCTSLAGLCLLLGFDAPATAKHGPTSDVDIRAIVESAGRQVERHASLGALAPTP